jgi:hypothetical protein
LKDNKLVSLFEKRSEEKEVFLTEKFKSATIISLVIFKTSLTIEQIQEIFTQRDKEKHSNTPFKMDQASHFSSK